MRTANRSDIASEHAFDMFPRARLVSEKMQYDPGHTIADQQIGRICLLHSETAEPLGKNQRGLILAAKIAASPQAIKGAHLIVSVVKPLRNLQCGHPSCAGLAHRTFDIDQRLAKCRIEEHCAALRRDWSGCKARERSVDVPVALLRQRQLS